MKNPFAKKVKPVTTVAEAVAPLSKMLDDLANVEKTQQQTADGAQHRINRERARLAELEAHQGAVITHAMSEKHAAETLRGNLGTLMGDTDVKSIDDMKPAEKMKVGRTK